jgi:hypothetical protein
MNLPGRTAELLDHLRPGEGNLLGELFELYRERLWRMLYVRLDRGVARRVSPDDVLRFGRRPCSDGSCQPRTETWRTRSLPKSRRESKPRAFRPSR